MKSVISQIAPWVILSFTFGLVEVSSKEFMIIAGPSPEIRELKRLPTNYNTDGVVPDTFSCGGPGRIVQWRYAPCRVEENPCQVPANGSYYQAEMDFVASKNIDSLGLRVNVKSFDDKINKEFNYEKPIVDSAVKQGHTYTILSAGGVTEELKGKPATFQYIIYDKFNNDVEICAEADIQYV